MGPISGLFTADFSPSTRTEAAKPSTGQAALAAVSTMIANVRKAAADRRLRNDLANMDDALLKDIGVADDEIYLIRAGQVFTPRAWAAKSGTRS